MLEQAAFEIEQGGVVLRTIEDGAILDWSSKSGSTPLAAQIESLRRGIIPLRYVRNLHSISIKEQALLCSSTVFVCGCGGLGGHVLELLARAGAGRIRFADPDVFQASDLNRQRFSRPSRLLSTKAVVIAEQLRSINPLLDLQPVDAALTNQNVENLVRGADVIVDALDNIESRFILADAARSRRVPLVHGAASGWWGQVTTLMPGRPENMNSIYGKTRERNTEEVRAGVVGPVPAVISGLQSLEAIKILVGREPAYQGKLLYFDAESGSFQTISLSAE